MKTTYFEEEVLLKRPQLQRGVNKVVINPMATEVQSDGRIPLLKLYQKWADSIKGYHP